ncbi:hypothetical protein D3C84_1022640 [compost metagenome]
MNATFADANEAAHPLINCCKFVNYLYIKAIAMCDLLRIFREPFRNKLIARHIGQITSEYNAVCE